jgi:nucleoside phosphorylase
VTSPDFAVVVALDTERDAVLDAFELSESLDKYPRPAFKTKSQEGFSGILYHINGQGLQDALSATRELLGKAGQDIDLVINIGIGGIIADDDLKIGDVVCASRAIEVEKNEKYDVSSNSVGEDQSIRLPGPEIFDAENIFKWQIAKFGGDPTKYSPWSSQCENQLDEFDLVTGDIGSSDPSPVVRTGPIASSGAVVIDKSAKDGFTDYLTERVDRNILSVDEESAGVLRGVKQWNAKHNGSVIPAVLRGMSDFADKNKAISEEGRQSYAAFTAVSLFKYLLENSFITDVFGEFDSANLPNPDIPNEVNTVRKNVSQLRGQIEGKFGVRHRSANTPLSELGLLSTSGVPLKRLLAKDSALESLLEELVRFEYATEHSQPQFRSDYAAAVFGNSLMRNRNILEILGYMRKNNVSNENIRDYSQNAYNTRLRFDVHKQTTINDNLGGTTIDSFITRSWDTKTIENHPWQPLNAPPKTIPEQTATENVVLERFDSYESELVFDISIESINGRVQIDGETKLTEQKTIPPHERGHAQFNLGPDSDLTRFRHDSEAFPWEAPDIIRISVEVTDPSGGGLSGTVYSNAQKNAISIPLPGAAQEKDGLRFPRV